MYFEKLTEYGTSINFYKCQGQLFFEKNYEYELFNGWFFTTLLCSV